MVTALCFVLALSLAAALVDDRFRERVEGGARVIDGDTIELAGRRLRLRGIDAPERDQTCEEPGTKTPCGQVARRKLQSLTAGTSTACRLYGKDRYGRDLADCEARDVFLNAWMVRSGFAVGYGDFVAEEQFARAERAGIWAGDFERPSEWRKRQGAAEEPPHETPGRIRAFLRALLGV